MKSLNFNAQVAYLPVKRISLFIMVIISWSLIRMADILLLSLKSDNRFLWIYLLLKKHLMSGFQRMKILEQGCANLSGKKWIYFNEIHCLKQVFIFLQVIKITACWGNLHVQNINYEIFNKKYIFSGNSFTYIFIELS